MTNGSPNTIDSGVNTQGECSITSQTSQYVINIVYEHLQEKHIHAVHRAKFTVIWSPLPLIGCDLYVYYDAFSFKGKQTGINALLLFEPIVVLPGQYNEDMWKHFDYIVTFYDTFITIDGSRFIKTLPPRSDWVVPADTTESLAEREIKYPLKGRKQAICMINGFKQSSMPGELYSKRVEAAAWFDANSDIPFDVYGNPPFPLPNYKGVLAHDAKLSTLSQYNYCLCFENIYHPQFSAGFISEKILDCLEARTIPIYLGASNIEEYIPKKCFIDFRDFKDYAELDTFLHTLSDKEYFQYVQTIDLWVSYGGLRPYSWYNLYNQLCRIINREEETEATPLFGATTQWFQGVAAECAHRPWTVSSHRPYWTWEFLSKEKSPLFLTEGNIQQQNIHLVSARQYESKNDYSRAIDELELAISNGLDSAEAHYMYAQLYIGMNRYEDAIGHLERVIAIDPSYAQAYDDLGVIYHQKNSYKKAMKLFFEAHLLNNLNYNALRNILVLSRQLGIAKASEAILKTMLAEHPKDTGFLAIAGEFNVTMEEDGNVAPVLMIQFGKTPQWSLSQDFLRIMASITKASVFIETGTFAGGTTAEAAKIFKEVHSIELSTELFKIAQERLKSTTNIHLYCGDSSDLLATILDTMKTGPYLLWLDGHYSEGPTAKGKTNTPILDEIRAIKESGLENTYLLVDDLRVFEKPSDTMSNDPSLYGYPTVEELYQEILTINDGYQLVILGDIALAYPQNAQINISPVARACTISRRYDETNFTIDEVLAAENIIAAAQDSELHLIQELLPAYSSTETGLGGHYMLWKGLTLNALGKYSEACEQYMMAKTSRINHWRLDWYLAQASNNQGNKKDALRAIGDVLAIQPDFRDGLIFYQNLVQNLKEELSQPDGSAGPDPEVAL